MWNSKFPPEQGVQVGGGEGGLDKGVSPRATLAPSSLF